MKRFLIASGVITILMIILCGCQDRAADAESPFDADDGEYLLACVLDLSGSYYNLMLGDHGKAYEQFVRIKDAYFRDRVSSGDRMILSQISGTTRAMLWDGQPRSFARDFPTPQAFKQFLQERSNPNGSRVHNSVADSLDYLVMLHDRKPSLKSAALIFSDMEDNDADVQGKQRLIESLKAYGKKNGVVGMYWVAAGLMPEWSKTLKESGLRHYQIEPEFKADPTLPTFD